MNRDQLRLPLDETSLRAELIGPGLGWRQLDVVEQTGSTNADLLARVALGIDIDGAVLLAEHQTAGRGRLGRVWSTAPRAQVAMSVGVRVVDVPVTHWGWLSLAAGLAVLDTVVAVTGVEAGLKWPNDVLAGPEDSRGKLAGILAEVARPFVVIGVGLNVTQGPEEIDGPGATSLLDLGVAALDRQQLITRLLRELDSRIDQWRSGDPLLADDYRAHSLTLGSRVRAELPEGGEVVGIARDIDEHGRLSLETAGRPMVISAGDVVHLR